MKRSKKIYLLLGVLIFACVATFSVSKLNEHKEKIKTSGEVVLEIPKDSVKTLSWKYESNDLAFHKNEENKWMYDGDEKFPVNQEKIEEFLGQFEQFAAAFIIEDVEDYGQYGLDKPVCTINISTEDKTYEILLGDYSTLDEQRYVSFGDGNVYLASRDPLKDFDAPLSEMIDNDKTPKFDKIKSIKFEGTENYSVTYEENSPRAYTDEDIYFTQINGKNIPLDTSRVNTYLSNITYLKLNNYMTYNVSDSELKEYGLDEPELKITVDYTAEDEKGKEKDETFVMSISQDPKEKNAKKEDKKQESEENTDNSGEQEEEEITAYVRVGDSKIVYKITTKEYKNVMNASYDALRHLAVISTSLKEINKIDISLEGNDYTITSEKKGDERTYYYQGEEIDFVNIQMGLRTLQAESFTNEQPTQKEEIKLIIHSDNKNYPITEVKLYRYDAKHCLAVVDGEPISLVDRSFVVDLIESVYQIVLK